MQARIKSIHPRANALKLSDTTCMPIIRAPHGAGRPTSQQQPIGSSSSKGKGNGRSRGWSTSYMVEEELRPEVQVCCESEVFEKVGLAYVPPHLRSLVA